MKFIKRGKRVSVKLALPDDLPWKVFGQLIADLGITEERFRLTSEHSEFLPKDELLGIIRNRSYDRLMDLLPDLGPQSIPKMSLNRKSDAYLFFCLYQAGSFLKKYPFEGNASLTKAKAIETFIKSEDICAEFNKTNHRALLALNERHPDFLGVIEEMRDDIRVLLGEKPDISSVIGRAAHGPGVSLGDQFKGGRVTDFYKWSAIPYTVTEATLPLAITAVESDPRWIGALDNWYRKEFKIPMGHPIDVEHFHRSIFRVVPGSRTTTVPKTALTDRTIAIEPLINVFLQLGVDQVIRSRLRKGWGYDLDSQVKNQELALEGSIDGSLATVDLSMASDLISLYICSLLLPPAWFDLLIDLRSPETLVDKVSLPLEKISSMGNGFTFALESLIFGAITRCAVRRTKSVRKSAVYGDDIIVPTTAFSYLQDLLQLCGFRLNKEKSFGSGPFRESCGKDFFLGYDVRPLFLTKKIRTVQDLFYLHNALYELQERLDWTWDVNLTKTLRLVRKWIPAKYRHQFYGPPSESLDTHLFSDKRLGVNQHNQRFYWVINTVPMKFNKTGYGSFFFRKLMASLHPRPRKRSKWDRERRLDTGNAFDVTRRDMVHFVCAKIRIP